ncbi:putative QWRF family protein [Helianthus annuus]|nr:putative QWRF family protein [Helianthus annuus]KAJ0933539.1 putative QWRF family protein [Helianthus annuus]
MMVSETTTRNQTIHDVIATKTSIKPKSRPVSSRYLSPSPSNSNSSSLRTVTPCRRSLSPLISKNSASPVVNRSVSVDRRRPARPDLTLKPNNATTGGGVTSTRSLSVSFQGEAFSLPISKTKITQQSPNLTRKANPERKPTPTGDHVENTKPMDHHRWPGRTRQTNATLLSKSFTLECGGEKSKVNCSNVYRELKLHQSLNLDSRRVSVDGGKPCLDLGDSVDLLKRIQRNPDGDLVKDSYSDTDSVSSGSTSGGMLENGQTRLKIGRSGIIVSPKFWQETNSRMRRLQDPSSSPLSTSPKPNASEKNLNSRRLSSDNNLLSSTRTMASPNRIRPLSPNKVMMTSPSRGMISPRRNSVSGINNNLGETPSVLSFAVDVRRGKVGENRFLDAHVLRLLYNRQLQWRFVNARNEDIVLKQKHSVEENLWNAWITIADMRDSVTRKRHRLQLLRQKLKLASILKAQMVFLEDWAYLDKNHSISLLGAIEALKASTLRLPVAAGATADLQSMKDAISSAFDVMQAMGSSMNSLCLQVEEVNLMVTKIAKLSAKERALLRNCKDFLSVLSALKVKECSLRTHVLQTSCVN